MREGDIALTSVMHSDGTLKVRPVLLLREFPPYNDFLVCGTSSQLQQYQDGYDVIISRSYTYFGQTGLVTDSVIRIFFLSVLPIKRISGSIGSVPDEILWKLKKNLSDYLVSKTSSQLI